MIHYCTDKTIPAGLLIERSIQELAAGNDELPRIQHLVIQFSHAQYYLPEQPQLELLALFSISMSSGASVLIEGSIFLFTPERLEQLQLLPNTDDVLRGYCRNHLLPWLVISDPWLLAPIHIPKPWGQEVWYTGIEARGQAEVTGIDGNIRLPWLLELMSESMGLFDSRQPILLKVLDPLPDEIYGDLYFELHQEKQEVYVVTHINESAWPENIGAIQLGFAAQARQLYQNDNEFKQAYLDSVRAYEQVRRLIDERLDEKKAALGIEPKQPIESPQLISWINELSRQPEYKELVDSEIELREVMNSFVEQYPLTIGDVVTVPKLVPHALQHGVRVVEFQTPVYERKILSFGQKVLTQSHWDTEEALELVDLDFARLQPSELLSCSSQLRIERIVNFDNFEVQRIQLNGQYEFDSGVYSILMVLQGKLTLKCTERISEYGSAQAMLLPKARSGWLISSSEPCTFLLASPWQPAK